MFHSDMIFLGALTYYLIFILWSESKKHDSIGYGAEQTHTKSVLDAYRCEKVS